MIEFEPATKRLATLVEHVRDDQLSLPTPCADTSVAALLDHLDAVSVAFIDAARKTIPESGSQPSSPNAAHLSKDWRTGIPERLAAMARAWRDEDAWAGMTEAGGFTFPADVAGVTAVTELVVHGWDIARASGQDYACEPRLLEAAYGSMQAAVARHPAGIPGVFGAPVPVAADAPLLDRLIGLSGRNPAWSPMDTMVEPTGMQAESAAREVLDRWVQVWHDGRLDLVPGCVAPVYTRHEVAGTREVTPETYAAEIAAARERMPNIRFDVHDYACAGDRVWFRWTARWTDPTTGQPTTLAGMQIYRLADGKLAETWVVDHHVGSAWPDPGRPWRSADFPPTFRT